MTHQIQPVMSEEFHIVLTSEDDARNAERQLATVTVDGRPAMRVRREGNDLMVGCGIFEKLEGEPVIAAAGSMNRKFFELFYLADGLKSGMHHPDGILWIRGPDRRHHVHDEKIPLRAVAPTLLAMFGIDPSGWMRESALSEAVGGAA